MTSHTRTHTASHWLAVAGVAVVLGTAHATLTASPLSLPPCATEDSVSCYWDGPTMGNGTGRSYTVDSDGVLTYTDGCSTVTAYRADGTETPVLGHSCK
jgi:hypothetical protein